MLMVEVAADEKYNRRGGGRPPGHGPLWCL